MDAPTKLKVRLVASRHPQRRGYWRFHFFNDSDFTFDSVRLEQVNYFAGGGSSSSYAQKDFPSLVSGGVVHIWTDDSDAAELQTDLDVRIRIGEGWWRVVFEMPKLYRLRNLPQIPEIDCAGYTEEDEASPMDTPR